MKPDRILGFIFFQDSYDNVVLPNEVAIKKQYESERFKYVLKNKPKGIDIKEWKVKKLEME